LEEKPAGDIEADRSGRRIARSSRDPFSPVSSFSATNGKSLDAKKRADLALIGFRGIATEKLAGVVGGRPSEWIY